MTTNHFTTVAALPSGGGRASHLAAEVAAEAARPYLGIPAALAPKPDPEAAEDEGPTVYVPSLGRSIPVPAHPLFKADRPGFEPFGYTERR